MTGTANCLKNIFNTPATTCTVYSSNFTFSIPAKKCRHQLVIGPLLSRCWRIFLGTVENLKLQGKRTKTVGLPSPKIDRLSRRFSSEAAKQHDVTLWRQAHVTGVLGSASASFWLDNNNQKLFQWFYEDFPKTELVFPEKNQHNQQNQLPLKTFKNVTYPTYKFRSLVF